MAKRGALVELSVCGCSNYLRIQHLTKDGWGFFADGFLDDDGKKLWGKLLPLDQRILPSWMY